MKNYDIFISYRREGGEQTAKIIYDKLKDLGYRVFLDVETLRSGAFNEKLYNVIEECKDFILILSPGALDRCSNNDDWVKLEIMHALKHNKNIVPILLRGFNFTDKLPQEIESIRYQNGPQASIEYFDGFIKKLCINFIKSKPSFLRLILHNASWRKTIIAFILFLLTLFGIIGFSQIWEQSSSNHLTYPSTIKEKNDVKNLIYHVELNLIKIDTIFNNYDKSLNAFEHYLTDSTEKSYEELNSQLQYTKKIFSEQTEKQITIPSELLINLSKTKINPADIKALCSYPDTLIQQYKDSINFLEQIVKPTNVLNVQTKKKLLDIYKEYKKLDVNSIYIGLCELFLPIDESALEDFRTKSSPFLSIKAQSSYAQWFRDSTELKSQSEAIYNRQQEMLVEISQIVGDSNINLSITEENLKNSLIASGMTRKEAQAYLDSILKSQNSIEEKRKAIEKLQQEINEGKNSINTLKEQARKKFAPNASDESGIVWGKALRFLSLEMYEDAINAFQFYYIQVKDSDEYAKKYVPCTIEFVKQIKNTGINYGVLVIGYEPNKAPHNFYQIGDIIIAINGQICTNYTDFKTLLDAGKKETKYTATVMRLNEKRELETVNITIPYTEPKIALINLKESN